MRIIKARTFRAEATVGIKRGYSNEQISIEEFKKELAGVQKEIFSEMNMKLSVKITPALLYSPARMRTHLVKESEKEKVIEQLNTTWTDTDNEVVKRMALFKEKSPDILKPILEA